MSGSPMGHVEMQRDPTSSYLEQGQRRQRVRWVMWVMFFIVNVSLSFWSFLYPYCAVQQQNALRRDPGDPHRQNPSSEALEMRVTTRPAT